MFATNNNITRRWRRAVPGTKENKQQNGGLCSPKRRSALPVVSRLPTEAFALSNQKATATRIPPSKKSQTKEEQLPSAQADDDDDNDSIDASSLDFVLQRVDRKGILDKKLPRDADDQTFSSLPSLATINNDSTSSAGLTLASSVCSSVVSRPTVTSPRAIHTKKSLQPTQQTMQRKSSIIQVKRVQSRPPRSLLKESAKEYQPDELPRKESRWINEESPSKNSSQQNTSAPSFPRSKRDGPPKAIARHQTC